MTMTPITCEEMRPGCDDPVAVAATLSFGNAMASLADFLFSGVLVRHPGLRLAYSEGQIGWLPYVLERADDVGLEHQVDEIARGNAIAMLGLDRT